MKKIVFGLVAVAVLVSACAKNVVPSTEQLRADDQQVIDEQPASGNTQKAKAVKEKRNAPAIGRDIDLIEYRSLKPFAVLSAERDKYLIYER